MKATKKLAQTSFIYKSKIIIPDLNIYRKNRKIQISYRGYIYTGIETTEEEARKDPYNWLKYIVLKALCGSQFILNPLKDIERGYLRCQYHLFS